MTVFEAEMRFFNFERFVNPGRDAFPLCGVVFLYLSVAPRPNQFERSGSKACLRQELASEMSDRTVGESSDVNLSRSIPIRWSTVRVSGTLAYCA